MKAWNLGNTTVRSPYRLKDGLVVLANSPLHGNLSGRENELEFARLLDDAGVVSVRRLREEGGSQPDDVGRKWRSALMQLGFITPGDPKLLSGTDFRPFEITPNGRSLISASTAAAEQEVFLRSLLAYQIPSVVERTPPPVFSPLRLVIEVLHGLEEQGLEALISFEEMSWIVQLARGPDAAQSALRDIQSYRRERQASASASEFDRRFSERVMGTVEGQSANTLTDYADLNLRYLKATGLFSSVGRGISIARDRRLLVSQLLSAPFVALDDGAYLGRLWQGAPLPTDNAPEAIAEIMSLAQLLTDSGELVQLPSLSELDIRELTQIRHGLEERWQHLQERAYAKLQRSEWQDILAYLRNLSNSRPVGIPRGEAPAYLEWALWRAFLAINSLCNEPWEARRFRVDRDFLPMNTAPGGGPDMKFVFGNYVLVVEVTLTSSSRQEAAEGEPVRRHVADVAAEQETAGKLVYGLFVANTIDSNTAETLRIGTWYKSDDSRMSLRIVPLTLSEFAQLFEAGLSAPTTIAPEEIERILLECLADRMADAPRWKALISQRVKAAVERLRQREESR